MTYSDRHINTVKPSQWINIGVIIIAIVDLFTIHLYLPLLLLIVRVIYVYFWRYEFHEVTLIERKGILNVSRTEIHYYRIKSIKVIEPFWMRIFGISKVHILTSDPYLPELILFGVKEGLKIRNELRYKTDLFRKEQGSREIDIYNLNQHGK